MGPVEAEVASQCGMSPRQHLSLCKPLEASRRPPRTAPTMAEQALYMITSSPAHLRLLPQPVQRHRQRRRPQPVRVQHRQRRRAQARRLLRARHPRHRLPRCPVRPQRSPHQELLRSNRRKLQRIMPVTMALMAAMPVLAGFASRLRITAGLVHARRATTARRDAMASTRHTLAKW